MISSSKSAPGTHCCRLLQYYSTANHTLQLPQINFAINARHTLSLYTWYGTRYTINKRTDTTNELAIFYTMLLYDELQLHRSMRFIRYRRYERVPYIQR